MSRVTKRQLDGIRKAIAKLDADVLKVADAIIERVGIDDAAALYDALIKGLSPICKEAAQLSAEIAAACYNKWRKASVGQTMPTITQSAYSEEKFIAAVKTATGQIGKGGTAQTVLSVLNSRIGYNSRASYSSTLFANGARDDKRPKFARVPGGSETCDFCLMLASNGFYYYGKTDGENVHNHANCDCVYVCSWDSNPRAEGYDPDEMYDRWQSSIEATAQERAERNGTTVEKERSEIMRKYRESANRANKRRRKV